MILTTLILKLIPLYISISLGFIAGRILQVDRDSVAKIVFYIIVPLVFFDGASKITISPNVLFLPFLTFILCTVISLAFYLMGKRLWQDNTKNLLAMSAGGGNTGYFGLPVAMMIFDEAIVGIYITAMIGFTIYESTTGFYITARGNHTTRAVLNKIARLPALYAFALGLLFNKFGYYPPDFINDFFISAKGAYAIFGMMLIGLGISAVSNFKFDFKFISMAFLAKFIFWPVIVLVLIYTDKVLLNLLNEPIYKALILLSIVPMAANLVVIATILKVHPEKAATAVLLSTLLALFYIPFMISLLGLAD